MSILLPTLLPIIQLKLNSQTREYKTISRTYIQIFNIHIHYSYSTIIFFGPKLCEDTKQSYFLTIEMNKIVLCLYLGNTNKKFHLLYLFSSKLSSKQFILFQIKIEEESELNVDDHGSKNVNRYTQHLVTFSALEH